jgi:molecular chaperone HscC
LIVGIDLGTTNSLISLWKDQQPALVANIHDSFLTPSVVGFDDEAQILVGQPAKERLVTHSQLTAAEFKRYMGSDKELSLGNKRFRPEELSSLVIRSLLDDAERACGERPTDAIVTVPAYFNDLQRKATQRAGELAGVKVIRLLNEPTAAALSYGVHEKPGDAKLVIVDLGGGTFDVSIIDQFDSIIEILGSGGDNYLGGADFTQIVAGLIVAKLKELGVTQWQCDQAAPLITRQAEQTKQQLNRQRQVTVSIVIEEDQHQVEISAEDFKAAVKPLIRRIASPIIRTLRDTKLDLTEINDVVLVGGASRMQVFRDEIVRMFGRFPADTANPDEIVALGAGVLVGLEENDEHLQEVVLTDVMPFTLGVEISREDSQLGIVSGYYFPIIERNRHIPTSRVETVYTTYDGQKGIKVNVYQGESPVVKDNVYIGSLDVDVTPQPRGEEAVDIRFTYDVNGALEVEVTVHSTQKVAQHIFSSASAQLSDKELQQRFEQLKSLKTHPRDAIVNTTLMSRAHRMYAEFIGDARQVIADQIFFFEHELASQEEERIVEARAKLEALFSELESSR